MDEQPPRMARAMDEREGYAAIDFGSTATRSCISITKVDPTTGKRKEVALYHVQELRAKQDPSTRFERGEYPSVGCPFDGPPFYIGFDAANQSAKRVISLKMIPYFRTANDDGHPFTKALFDHHKSLPSEEAKEEFNKTLDDMLQSFFNVIVGRIIEKSESLTEGFKLRKLSVCIPNTWSTRENDMQKYLGPILDKTIPGGKVEVSFMFEALAQAQFVIHRHPDQLRTYDYLMVLDFGGHSMGGSDGVLVWSDPDRPRMISPPNGDFGVRGGYEIWEILIGHLLDDWRKGKPRRQEMYPEDKWHIARAALLKKFFLKKSNTDYHNERRLKIDLREVLGPSVVRERCYSIVSLTGDQVSQAWESAFREVITVAQNNISRIATNDKNILVLLSGGSIENVRARDEITGFCSNFQLQGTGANVECKTISDDIDVMSCKWLIAEGGARCLAATMDVEEFFDRGGSLALMSVSTRGGRKCNHGKLLFCKKQEGDEYYPVYYPVDIEIKEGRQLRLVAAPIHRPLEDDRKVPRVKCYDIWDLPLDYKPTADAADLSRIPAGNYTMNVDRIIGVGADAGLILQLQSKIPKTRNLQPKIPKTRNRQDDRRSEGVPKGRSRLDEGQCLMLEVPLASNGSNNLVELDLDLTQGKVWVFEEDEMECDLAGVEVIDLTAEDQDGDDNEDNPLEKRRKVGDDA